MGCCNDLYKHKPVCKGMMLAALGVILVLNQYKLNINWWYLFGGLLIFKGLMVIALKGKCFCMKDENCCESHHEEAHESMHAKHHKKH